MSISEFVKAMKDKGIHVGWGKKPYCVTCDEPWPCRTSIVDELTAEAERLDLYGD